jgi:hypothetical protein
VVERFTDIDIRTVAEREARDYLREVEALAREARLATNQKVLIGAIEVLATRCPVTLRKLYHRLLKGAQS